MKLLELSIIILSVDSTALSRRVLTEFDSQICNFVSFGSHLLSLPTSKAKKKVFSYIYFLYFPIYNSQNDPNLSEGTCFKQQIKTRL